MVLGWGEGFFLYLFDNEKSPMGAEMQSAWTCSPRLPSSEALRPGWGPPGRSPCLVSQAGIHSPPFKSNTFRSAEPVRQPGSSQGRPSV